MSKQQKGLVPELRFPEFEKEPNWPYVQLNTVAKRSTSKNKGEKVSRVLTNSAVDGVVDQRDYFEKDIAVKGNLESYYIVDKGDYVYNPRISSTAPVGPISKNKVGKGVMSPLYTVFKFNSKKNDFFEQFFKSSRWHGYLQTISNSGARHDRMSITSGEFMAMPVPNPGDMEQQKIADCLASIDELITLHTQKLDALKDHKKGLMQQLFPAEGETVPKLRFPEFRGEWSWSALENISSKVMVGIASAATHAYRDKGVVLFRNQNIKDGYLDDSDILFIDADYERSHKNKRLMPGDLLTARTGYPGLTCVVPEKYKGSQSFTTLITRPIQSRIDPRFLCYYINSDKGQAFFDSAQIGGGQKNVNAGSLSEMPIPYPELTEQQKIADFLSAIDEQINAQSQGVESLKSHKKGLVQKLFPVMDEVN